MASHIFFLTNLPQSKLILMILDLKNILTLHNVIIHIKSLLIKDKNYCYYKIFLEKYSYQLAKKKTQNFVSSIIMVRFGKKEIAKEKFYTTNRPIRIWDINVDNLVISRLVKLNSKYLIGYEDKAVRPLVLIMPKMSGYVKAFKVEVNK